MIADANGDLFGTTYEGGANNDGTAFEIINTGTVAAPIYASAPIALVTFNGSNGANPVAGLTTDANGNLFGTTDGGGLNDEGTVFEIQNTGTVAAPVYATAPTTLVTFTWSDGVHPEAGLIADANGDLFGTTEEAGAGPAGGSGTVFEIKNTGTVGAPVYASAPTTLVFFRYSNGRKPNGLSADANGDLFGTTEYGGANKFGTVFEISGAGFVVTDQWNNNGDWNLNSATDWSLGSAPTSTTPAEIQTGLALISSSGAAEQLTIDSGATLTLDDGTRLSITDLLDNGGTWGLGGGDTATIGGLLINSGALDIGNTGISASTTVTAASLDNTGSIDLQGAAASGAAGQATLDIAGAAPKVLAGAVRVAGDATLEFGSGGVTTIGPGASLRLVGAEAQILTGGASSALTGLTKNLGTLLLRGDSVLGAGGASLTTTTSFTNVDITNVDNTSGDGGSAVTIGGGLTNTGTFSIGNSGLSGETAVTAQTLINSGSITLAGSSGNLAELVVNGLAKTTGALTIGAGAELDVTGSHVFAQAGGSTTVTGSLVASAIDANAGMLDFKSALTSGDGGGALNIGSAGTLEFDKAVDATHRVKFAAAGGTLALGDPGGFKGTVSSFAVSDAIDLLGKGITSLAYSGSSASGILTVDGSGGAIAHLSFDGDYTRSSFTFGSDGHGGSEIRHT